MRLPCVLAVAALLAATGSAHAAPNTTNARPPVVVPAEPDGGFERREALATQLLDVTGFDEIARQTLEAVMPALIEQEMSGLTSASRDEMADLAVAAMGDIMPEFRAVSLRIYAQVFTEAELRAMIAFYGSPEGRSINEKTPLLSLRQQQAVEAIAPLIEEAIRRRGCDRYGCGPEAPRA